MSIYLSRIRRKFLIPDLTSALLAQLLPPPLQELLYPLAVHPSACKSQHNYQGKVEDKGSEPAVLLYDHCCFLIWLGADDFLFLLQTAFGLQCGDEDLLVWIDESVIGVFVDVGPSGR